MLLIGEVLNEVCCRYWNSEQQGAESTVLMASGMYASIVLFMETVLPKMGITVQVPRVWLFYFILYCGGGNCLDKKLAHLVFCC
jgi:hypothetical protein